jgi:hypothetical protein
MQYLTALIIKLQEDVKGIQQRLSQLELIVNARYSTIRSTPINLPSPILIPKPKAQKMQITPNELQNIYIEE